HRRQAADALARAAALGEAEAGPRAAALYEAIHRFADALALVGEDPAQRDRLRALASEEGLHFDFTKPLDDRWAIDPLAVRRQGGRLQLTLGGAEAGAAFGPGHAGVVARREISWDGAHPLILEVEIESELIEWGSGVHVELRPIDVPDRVGPRVGIEARGGGGIYQLLFGCVGEGRREPETDAPVLDHKKPVLGAKAAARRLRLQTAFVPGARVLWCSADGEGIASESEVTTAPLEPGRYELLIRG
ncbi:MAG: hypothetical protein KC457_35395, partial [Myxococcales bacterium]|nr:hypothetical protein [Myxococcales bacterium]